MPPDLTPETLLRAYRIGLFPMAEGAEDNDLFWVDPDMRGIMPLRALHIPRSLRKILKKPWDIRVDTAFADVMQGCAASTEKRPETWINREIYSLFCDLHTLGHAHSVEVWQDDQLVGGLYGLHIGGVFFGESMFSRAPNASKVAFVDLIHRLNHSGFALLDTQFLNDHLRQFGAIEIPRESYKTLLSHAVDQSGVTFYTGPLPRLPSDFIGQ
jgi:leucyl/phenylalanyl-tRNA--protein transferase